VTSPAVRDLESRAQLTEAMARLMLAAAWLGADAVEKLTQAVCRLCYETEHLAQIERDIHNGE
jgi:uncharacterized protein YbjQ (UPF0145 family)